MSKAFKAAVLALASIIGSPLVVGHPAAGDPAPAGDTPTYTAAQAERGRAIYAATCFACHGANLDDGEFAAPLKGPAFRQKWGGQGLDALFTIMTTMMPPDNPGGLGPAAYADVLAFMLGENGVDPTPDHELPADIEALKGKSVPP